MRVQLDKLTLLSVDLLAEGIKHLEIFASQMREVRSESSGGLTTNVSELVAR